ncbi:hypothetical protein CPB86DRAFT_533445 [Serendipita vermifera]|nr:hypothetical protein CPB86DRAFT_533445 [Serendipita vermifera]
MNQTPSHVPSRNLRPRKYLPSSTFYENNQDDSDPEGEHQFKDKDRTYDPYPDPNKRANSRTNYRKTTCTDPSLFPNGGSCVLTNEVEGLDMAHIIPYKGPQELVSALIYYLQESDSFLSSCGARKRGDLNQTRLIKTVRITYFHCPRGTIGAMIQATGYCSQMKGPLIGLLPGMTQNITI